MSFLKHILTIPLLFVTFSIAGSYGQVADTTSFRLNPRFSFYSDENNGEMIVHIPQKMVWTKLKLELEMNGSNIGTWTGIPGKTLLSVPVNLGFPPAIYTITAEISSSSGKKFMASTDLVILKFKPNEVKTDRLTGGLLISKREFLPFGFYCYSPVYPTLPEEEIVKGFNMISPYQRILPETFAERKAYMDRCAAIGMKVHYNLLSVSGGGGVSSGSNGMSDAERKEILISEIRSFMDHPALLGWYISDEPNGHKVPPETLEEIYRLIKDIDPWHPVSIVFMAPFLASKNYANALDIVMADPYPVPKGSVLQVGNITAQLTKAFEGDKPVWIVPQAFGGGEWWEREPTIMEMRNMTYQSIVNGARGIQYFIRHGLNSFPKSTAAWNECGKMAMEIAEITPWLLSDEKSIPVQSSSVNVRIASYVHGNILLIIAVNMVNSPQKTDISITGNTLRTVRILFENRSDRINSGTFSDYLPAFGSQVYLIDIKPTDESVKPFKGNLIRDPGFEDLSSPGVPSACYSWNEGDRGSTYFLDTREHLEGDHSLRIITPQENKGTRIRFFPVNVSRGRTYILSVWAKTDSVFNPEDRTPYFELGLGEFGRKRFSPSARWKQYTTSVTLPTDTIPSERVNAILRMPGKGVTWFDMVQVFEATDINRSINPELNADYWTK